MHKHSLKGGWGASMSEVDITKRHPQLAASTLTGHTTVTHNTEMSKMFPQWQSKHPRDLISARASDYHWKTSLSRQRLHREDTHSHTHTRMHRQAAFTLNNFPKMPKTDHSWLNAQNVCSLNCCYHTGQGNPLATAGKMHPLSDQDTA